MRVTADARKVDKPVDPPKQMIARHVIIHRKLVKKRALRHLPRIHHRPNLLAHKTSESALWPSNNRVFQHYLMLDDV